MGAFTGRALDDAHQAFGATTVRQETVVYLGRTFLGPLRAAFRFGVVVPAGATVTAAALTVRQGGENGSTVPVPLSVAAQDVRTPGPFGPGVDNLTSRPATIAKVPWVLAALPGFQALYGTPDLAAVVQELVDRHGGIDGLALFVDDDGSPASTYWTTAVTMESTSQPGQAALLEVAWTLPGEVPVPVAGFTATPTTGQAPLAVQFQDASQGATTWSWDFGDATTSVEPSPLHVFQLPGAYTVTLTVTNAAGSSQATATITATTEPPPQVAVPAVTGMQEAAAATLLVGSNLTMSVGARVEDAAASGTVIGQSPVAGTLVQQGSVVTVTVSAGLPPPPPPPAGPAWPDLVGLSVGESVTRTYPSGTWTLTLVSYQVVTYLKRVVCDLRVTGPGAFSSTVQCRVGRQQADIVIGGMRVYPFIERDAFSIHPIELAGAQGGPPAGLQDGSNDVAFLINAAAGPLFPPGRYPYGVPPWTGSHFQLLGEQNGPFDIHSGHDVPVPGGTAWVAPYDGWIYASLGSQIVFVPDLPPNAGFSGGPSAWSGAPLTIIATHTDDATAVFPNGTYVAAGTVCVRSNLVNAHFHSGSKGHQAGGSVLFDMQKWDENEGMVWVSPRFWRVSAPVAGDALAAPLPGTPDPAWKIVDTWIHGPVPVGNMVLSDEFTDPHTVENSYAHCGTWVYSPRAQTALLRLGATRNARVSVNDVEVARVDNTARFASLNAELDPILVLDQVAVSVALLPGWNPLVVTSDTGVHGAGTDPGGRQWAFTLKVEAPSGVSFSTRALALQEAAGLLTWLPVQHHNVVVDQYLVAADQTPDFLSPQVQVVTGTSVPVATLQGRYVSVVPDNSHDGEFGPYSDFHDVIALATIPAGSTLPSQDPPAFLAPAETPQFVLLGMDDNPNPDVVTALSGMLAARRNPPGSGNAATFDGAPMSMSFYLIGQNLYGPNINAPTQRASYVNAYLAGMELGNHTFWHNYGGAGQPPWPVTVGEWEADWGAVDAALRQMLLEGGVSVPEVDARRRNRRGTRESQDHFSPESVQAARNLGYEYNCSHRTGHSSNLPAWWPGTLDAGWPGAGTFDTQVIGNTPGHWEIPQTYLVTDPLTGATGGYCDGDVQTALPGLTLPQTRVQYMRDTVLRALNGNRAPVGVCLHDGNWASAAAQTDLAGFLDWLLAVSPDVRVVTHAQFLDWRFAPVPLGLGVPPPPPPPPPPAAALTATPLTGTAPLAVQFTDTSTGQVDSRSWNFGDGQVSAEAAPLHVYEQPGPYTATLTVTNQGGSSAATATVTVSAAPLPDITLAIDRAVVVAVIPPTFPGAASAQWMHPASPDGLYQADIGDIPHLVQMSRLGRVWAVRFGGGNWVNHTGWTRDRLAPETWGVPWSQHLDDDPNSPMLGMTVQYWHTYQPRMFDSLATFCRLTGSHAVIQINGMDNNPGMWADLVKYTNVELGYGFRYWELSNEPDLNEGGNLFRQVFGSNHEAAAREYARRFIRYADALHAQDPTVKLLGPVLANPSEGNAVGYRWLTTFVDELLLQGRADTLGGLVWHAYFRSVATGPEAPDLERGWAPRTLMNYNTYLTDGIVGNTWVRGSVIPDTHWLMVTRRRFAETQMDAINAIVARLPVRPPLFVTEFRNAAGDGQQDLYEHPITIPWMVDVAHRMLERGVEALNWYDLYDAGLIRSQLVAPLALGGAKPALYGQIILAELIGTRVIGATLPDPAFGAFATEDARAVWVHLVNPDAQERRVVVNLAGVPASRATTWTLVSTGPVDAPATIQSVGLNGYRIDPAASAAQNLAALYAAGQVSEPLSATLTVVMPPYALAVVALSSGPVGPKPPLPPAASMSALPASGQAPLSVQFRDASKGDIDSWSWNFGDGQLSALPSPSHVYDTPGPYEATLTVTGPGGVNQASVLVVVAGVPVPPVAVLSALPIIGVAPLAVQFQDLSTGAPTTRSWDFGDGATSVEQSPVHVYEQPGSYPVTLAVANLDGSSSETVTVTVLAPPPPQAAFDAVPGTGTAPLAVAFQNRSEGAFTAFLWEFGDGTTSAAMSPSHTYPLPGAYTVTLTATGPGGATLAQAVIIVEAALAPPLARFVAQPVVGAAPLTVQFIDTSVGAGTRLWGFGDGATSVAPNPSHTYQEPGQYVVTLTVSNDAGQDSAALTVVALLPQEGAGASTQIQIAIAVGGLVLSAVALTRRR